MASITFQYRSKKESAPLEARLLYTIAGIRGCRVAKTKIEVSQSFWDEYKAGKNFRDVSKANLKTKVDADTDKIRRHILDRYTDDVLDNPDWLEEVVHEYYYPKKVTAIPDDLLGYFKYYMDIRSEEIKPGTGSYKKWMEIQRKVTRFEKDTKTKYLIKDVDESFKVKWQKWCAKQLYAPETIAKNFSYIKMILFHAAGNGITTSRNFNKLSIKVMEHKPAKIYLSFEELAQIKALTGLSESLDNVRDWLLISCYTGQRVSDFMRFTSSMIRAIKGKKFIDVKQVKTGKDVSIPLLPEVQKILDKRNGEFPRRISDQKYNGYVKEVCRLAGITEPTKGKLTTFIQVNGKPVKRSILGTYPKYELIGSHVGRRSLATNYYGKIPTSFLKDITGHGTEAMLLRYIGKTSKDTAFEAYDLMINAK